MSLYAVQELCIRTLKDKEFREAIKRDPAAAIAHQDVWVKVLDKLKAGTMPPRTMPPLPASDSAAVIGWIEKLRGIESSPESASASMALADPGRGCRM